MCVCEFGKNVTHLDKSACQRCIKIIQLKCESRKRIKEINVERGNKMPKPVQRPNHLPSIKRSTYISMKHLMLVRLF